MSLAYMCVSRIHVYLCLCMCMCIWVCVCVNWLLQIYVFFKYSSICYVLFIWISMSLFGPCFLSMLSKSRKESIIINKTTSSSNGNKEKRNKRNSIYLQLDIDPDFKIYYCYFISKILIHRGWVELVRL